MNDIDKRFGNFLKEKRNEKKYTQEELANMLEIPRTTYQHYEKGETQVTLDFVKAVIDALEIPIAEMEDFFKRLMSDGR